MPRNPDASTWCAKNNFVTINGYDTSLISIDELVAGTNYFCYTEEEAPTTGQPHMHMVIQWKERHRMSVVKRILGHEHANIQTQRDDKAVAYCKFLDYDDATGTGTLQNPYFHEFGEYESLGSQVDSYGKALALARQGKFEEIDPGIYLRFRAALRAEFVRPPLEVLSKPCGHWFHGPPGCGKSESAQRIAEPSRKFSDVRMFFQMWPGDSYKYKALVFDDVTPSNAQAWYNVLLDCAHTAPIGIKPMYQDPYEIRPTYVFVTSNYTIDQCFPDVIQRAAISRRFQFYDFINTRFYQPTLYTNSLPDRLD